MKAGDSNMYKVYNNEIKVLKGKDNEYIIKDKYGINLGVIFIIELSAKNKFCSFRIKFYKNDESHREELKKALDLMVTSLFKNTEVLKIDVIVDQDTMLSPFTELGFTLEGIFINSYTLGNERRSELVFGVEISEFKKDRNINILRLKGKNVELKILTPEDSQDILDYYKRNKNYLQPFEPLREESFYTIEAQTESLIESYKQFLNGTSAEFGIYKDKKFIGKIRLSNIVRGIFKNAFIGYSIDKDEQNNGYMKEAIKLLLEYAFEDMELHRIEASTLVDNEKSQRVLISSGFKEIGISEKYLFINGKWRDHKIFYKTNK